MSGRDERIDMLRGLAMIAVLVNHAGIPSFYQVLTVEGMGIVTGAEGFVLMSGVMVGLVYHRKMQRDGWPKAAKSLWGRAARLYLVALATNLAVYLLKLANLFDMASLTTYWDRDLKRMFSLYGDHESPATFALNMITLAHGPGQINILGLYVVLIAAAPVLLLLLRRRGVFVLVGVSWALYLLQLWRPMAVLPSQSENAFPILSWQLLFVHGMLAGYYRERLVSLFRGPYGPLGCLAVVASALGFWLFSLNNPWPEVAGRIRLFWIGEGTYYWIYQHFFARAVLGPGRFLNTLVLAGTLYLFLTQFWTPIRRLAGWLLIPIGRSTLYVFVAHLAFVLAVENLGLVERNNLWLNTLAVTLIILTIGLMVRSRFLMWRRHSPERLASPAA